MTEASRLSRLRRLLHPRVICVVGGSEAAEVIRQCDGMGFPGAIYAVNPHRREMAGRPCYAHVDDIPEPPDAAFVAVPREITIEVVGALARRGAGGVVCYASGFKEAGGDGEALQRALVVAAGEMPLVGPNCYGLINYLDGAPLWPDQHGGVRCERGVAIFTQSSNIAVNLTMTRRALPIAYLVALGNQANVGLAQGIEVFVDDPRVSAIGLHIEGIDDVRAFDDAARRALAAGKPVVALKAGRSEAGARLTMTHTASLAGADRVMDAYFRRVGVARVHAIPAFVETLKMLHAVGPLPGRALVSMSCSGGEASLVADAAEGRGLDFRSFTPGQHDAVKATLSDLVAVSNPLDYHTFIWGDPARMRRTFGAVLACGFDLGMLVLDLPRPDRCDDTDWRTCATAFADAVRESGARAAVVATLPECLPEELAADLVAQGIAPHAGLDDALTAAEAAADIGAAQRGAPPAPLMPDAPASSGSEILNEASAKSLLARHGLTVPAARIVHSPEAAAQAAGEIGFPVALKAIAMHVAHKSEIGAVRLGLNDASAVRAAAGELLELSGDLLVEALVTEGVAELIVGVNRDPHFGPCLVVGSGGVLVELTGDVRVLPLPARRTDIEDALTRLRVFALLAGFRGREPGDVEAAIAAVQAIAAFAVKHAGRLMELDVNPLIVRRRGAGAVVADAFIRWAAEQEAFDERSSAAG